MILGEGCVWDEYGARMRLCGEVMREIYQTPVRQNTGFLGNVETRGTI